MNMKTVRFLNENVRGNIGVALIIGQYERE